MRNSVVPARLRRSPGRRLAVALFAVPAILVGLLGMHVLTTGGMGEPMAAAISAIHAAAAAPFSADRTDMAMGEVSPPAPAPLPLDNCCGLCGPRHGMLGMACVLALLVALVLLTLHLVLAGWQPLGRHAAALLAKAAALAPPSPPSLHVLSISRT